MANSLSKDDVAQFNREMAYYKNESRESVRNAVLNAIDEAGDEPSDDDLRAICSVAVDSMCIATYGDWEYIAAMSDDLVRILTGGSLPGFDFDASGVFSSESEIRAIVDSHMDSVRSGDMSLNEFSNRVADCADIEVKNMHARTLDRIVGGRSDARWARVPVGESCEWCIMTGSLGYYYYSAQAAAKASHAKCNCLIVPKVGNKTPEIDGYDPDELYMQWVKSVKEEGMRPEHELTKARKHKNSLHRDGWETVNPVEVICDMLPMARRDRKREEGSKKIIWGSDYASYLVLIEPSEGYFRIIDTENKDGKQPFVYYDGRTFDKDTDNDLYLKNTHYKILGFENA